MLKSLRNTNLPKTCNLQSVHWMYTDYNRHKRRGINPRCDVRGLLRTYNFKLSLLIFFCTRIIFLFIYLYTIRAYFFMIFLLNVFRECYIWMYNYYLFSSCFLCLKSSIIPSCRDYFEKSRGFLLLRFYYFRTKLRFF